MIRLRDIRHQKMASVQVAESVLGLRQLLWRRLSEGLAIRRHIWIECIHTTRKLWLSDVCEDGADVPVSTMLNDMLRDAKLTSRVTILDTTGSASGGE